jgi:gliding motility-associated-like protein
MRRIVLTAGLILTLFISKTASSQVVYPCGTYYVNFNGINYYGRFSNCFGTTGITGDFTLSAWIRLTDTAFAGKEMDIFHRQVNGFSPSEGTDGINLYISTDGSIKFRAYIRKGGSCILDSMVCGPAPDPFKWYHIAVTFRASDGSCNAYVNGVLSGSASFGGDLNRVYPYLDYLAIGKKEVLNRYEIITYKGDMDELAFCAKELTSDEVKTLANGLVPGSPLMTTYKITDYDKLDNYPGGVNSGIGNGQVGVYGQLYRCSNKPPVANAGPDQTITLPTSSVMLDGTSSSDPDGTIVKYQWTKISGPPSSTETISNAQNIITPVNGLIEGVYVFQLAVTDNTGATSTAQVKVSVIDNSFWIVDPNPSLIKSDGTIDLDPSHMNLSSSIKAVSCDGETRVLIVLNSNEPVQISLENADDGRLSSNQFNFANLPVIQRNVNGKVVVLYRSPDGLGADFPYDPQNGRTRKIILKATKQISNVTLDIPILLFTPPVVFVHGMWSSPTAWDKYATFLKNEGFKQPNFADYSFDNAATFDPRIKISPARNSVMKAIFAALGEYRINKIAATQVDVIGHSNGGMMSRSLSIQPEFLNIKNFQAGYIHKLITLGSPHGGAQVGPYLWENRTNVVYITYLTPTGITSKAIIIEDLLRKMNQPAGQCHPDFGKTSDALQALAATPKFHTFAVVGDYFKNGPESLAPKFGNSDAAYWAVDDLFRVLGGKSHKEVYSSSCANLDREINNDLYVSIQSQKGGIATNKIFTNTAHSHLPGIFWSVAENTSDDIEVLLKSLLLSNKGTEFGNGFPASSTIPSDCYNGRTNYSSTDKAQKTSSSDSLNKVFENDRGVTIVSPLKGAQFAGGSRMRVEYTPFGKTKPTSAVLMLEELGWYSLPVEPPYQAEIQIPRNYSLGSHYMSILVRDTSGFILADTTHILLNPVGNLLSVTTIPSTIQLDSLNAQAPIHVIGTYLNGYDTIKVDITRKESGTTYTAKKGVGSFTITNDGVLKAVSEGVDTLLIFNGNASCIVPIDILGNFNSFVRGKSQIVFPPIGDKTVGDAPFSLSAYTTSDVPVLYKLVNGGANLQDGIVAINSPGRVTINVSAAGNEYYDQPDTQTQSFCVNPAAVRVIVGDTNSCAGSSKFYFKKDNTLKYIDSSVAYNWNVIGGIITKKVGDTAYINWSAVGTQSLQVQPEVDGCKGKAISIIVSVNPVSVPIITPSGPISFCNSDSLVISSTNATAYQWYKNDTAIVNATNQSITVRGSGKYNVRTINSTGCTAVSAAVNVDVTNSTNPPSIAAQGPTNFCNGDSVVLTSSSSTGNQWYRNDTLAQGATANTYTAKRSGNYSVKVTSGSCSSRFSSSITVLVNTSPSPSISASGSTTFCDGSNVQLKTDTIYNSYQWYRDGNSIGNATNRTYAASEEGSYTVLATSNGCSATSKPVTLTVTTNTTKPTITLSGPSSFCADSSVTLSSSASTANQWYRNDTLIIGATTTTYRALTSGIYTVKATVGTCSNVVSQPVSLSVIPLPSGSIQATTLQLCPSKGVTLTATGGTNYEWYFNNSLISGAASNIYNAKQPGSYSVTIVNNGCRAKAQNQVTLSLAPKPSISFSFDSYCKNRPVLFVNNTADTAVSYQWLFGDSFSSTNKSPTHVYTQAATFKVTLTENLRSCPEMKDSFSKNIVIQEPRIGIKYPVVQTSIGSTVQLAARTIGKDYVWKPSTDLNNAHIPNPVLMVKSDRLYLIEITSDAGCITVDTLEVMINKGSRIGVPKGFTPNGDGVNDLLRPIVQNIVSLKFFRVYNRWGQLVYETKTIGQGWDGTFNGQRQPVETYTWAVEGIDTDGKAIKASGKSLLIR